MVKGSDNPARGINSSLILCLRVVVKDIVRGTGKNRVVWYPGPTLEEPAPSGLVPLRRSRFADAAVERTKSISMWRRAT